MGTFVENDLYRIFLLAAPPSLPYSRVTKQKKEILVRFRKRLNELPTHAATEDNKLNDIKKNFYQICRSSIFISVPLCLFVFDLKYLYCLIKKLACKRSISLTDRPIESYSHQAFLSRSVSFLWID